MPEGDTIAWAANRIRPVLEGRVPDEVETPHPRHELDHWPERLAGREVSRVTTHGKHLFGIGNIWKAEACWEAGIDPWRPVRSLPDEQALAIIDAVRPRMMRSALDGPRSIRARVYGLAGRPCRRCGSPIIARRQGDENRITYWCQGCQS